MLYFIAEDKIGAVWNKQKLRSNNAENQQITIQNMTCGTSPGVALGMLPTPDEYMIAHACVHLSSTSGLALPEFHEEHYKANIRSWVLTNIVLLIPEI